MVKLFGYCSYKNTENGVGVGEWKFGVAGIFMLILKKYLKNCQKKTG